MLMFSVLKLICWCPLYPNYCFDQSRTLPPTLTPSSPNPSPPTPSSQSYTVKVLLVRGGIKFLCNFINVLKQRWLFFKGPETPETAPNLNHIRHDELKTQNFLTSPLRKLNYCMQSELVTCFPMWIYVEWNAWNLESAISLISNLVTVNDSVGCFNKSGSMRLA